MTRIQLLTVSTLYPNAAQPHHGTFVEQRLLHLVASGEVTAHVVAPVPWFPLRHPRFGRYARFAAAPHAERRGGLRITHPRYLTIPKFGMTVAPRLLAHSVDRHVRSLAAAGLAFDLIDAHYLFPDAVAAVRVARKLGVPAVVTARGSDVNLVAQFPLPRRLILDTLAASAAVICVSAALKAALVKLGADGGRITVIRNGVDLKLFRPDDRAAARRALKVERPALACVGKIEPAKGQQLVVEALVQLPQYELLIVGDGPMRNDLGKRAVKLGVADRVRFLGELDHGQVSQVYNAADALVLASEREGMPNVVLEALACGLPVICTAVGGIPEILKSPAAGVLLAARTPEAIVNAVTGLERRPLDRGAVRSCAEEFGWPETVRAQLALYRDVMQRKHRVAE